MKRAFLAALSVVAVSSSAFMGVAHADTSPNAGPLGSSVISNIVKPLPPEVASLPQAKAPAFNGITVPGVPSYKSVYEGAFARIYWKAKEKGHETNLIETSKDAKAPNLKTRWYGNPKAPIKILELESLTCSHCAEFSNVEFPRFKKEYIDTGRVYYGIRQLAADRVSVTANILGAQLDDTRFAQYTSAIFSNQYKFFQDIKKADVTLRNIANLSGFTNEQFDKAWNDNVSGQRVFLQGLGDVTYYSKAVEKIQGKPVAGFGTPFFLATNGTKYAFTMGASPKEFKDMLTTVGLLSDKAHKDTPPAKK